MKHCILPTILLTLSLPLEGATWLGPDPIQKFFRPTVVIDGLPVYEEQWVIWNGRGWVAIEVTPTKPDPWPPATGKDKPRPKHQRRLE